MILSDLLAGAKSKTAAFDMLEELLELNTPPKRPDDIKVRTYVVRTHWRKRWHPKVEHLEDARRRRKAV